LISPRQASSLSVDKQKLPQLLGDKKLEVDELPSGGFPLGERKTRRERTVWTLVRILEEKRLLVCSENPELSIIVA
jgi:hypothetical protein